MKVYDFYTGFEGEPEMKIYDELEMIDLWGGYFNQLMCTIKPINSKWIGLSKFYHCETGWFEESPWKITELDNALKELNSINIQMLDKKTQEIYVKLVGIIGRALEQNKEVIIEYF